MGPTLVPWLLRWLLFRLELGAGLIKLRGDACWSDLTCLRYHHETQPLPGPFSWHFHHLPMWAHKAEVLGNHAAQLVLPVALFLPHPLAAVPAALMIVTQCWLIASGNFSWLNFLTIAIAIPIVGGTAGHPDPTWHQALAVALTVLVVVLSWRPARNLFSRRVPVATDIVLVAVNQSETAAIFRDELRAHARDGHLCLVEHYDDRDGLLDVESLDVLVPDLSERLTYACGPAGLLDALEQHHAERGLRLTTERFRPVLVEPGEGGTITFASGAVVDADGATPILDAAEGAGVLMPSGCRMGICMGCVLPMKSGVVRDLRIGELTVAVPGETHPDGVKIQTCISAAAGDCHIDH